MHYSANGPLREYSFQNRQHIGFGVATVYHDWQIQVACQAKMAFKVHHLNVECRVAAVPVESGLANGPHARLPSKLDDATPIVLTRFTRVIRMNTDRREHMGFD
jgi:hypothetical protein